MLSKGMLSLDVLKGWATRAPKIPDVKLSVPRPVTPYVQLETTGSEVVPPPDPTVEIVEGEIPVENNEIENETTIPDAVPTPVQAIEPIKTETTIPEPMPTPVQPEPPTAANKPAEDFVIPPPASFIDEKQTKENFSRVSKFRFLTYTETTAIEERKLFMGCEVMIPAREKGAGEFDLILNSEDNEYHPYFQMWVNETMRRAFPSYDPAKTQVYAQNGYTGTVANIYKAFPPFMAQLIINNGKLRSSPIYHYKTQDDEAYWNYYYGPKVSNSTNGNLSQTSEEVGGKVITADTPQLDRLNEFIERHVIERATHLELLDIETEIQKFTDKDYVNPFLEYNLRRAPLTSNTNTYDKILLAEVPSSAAALTSRLDAIPSVLIHPETHLGDNRGLSNFFMVPYIGEVDAASNDNVFLPYTYNDPAGSGPDQWKNMQCWNLWKPLSQCWHSPEKENMDGYVKRQLVYNTARLLLLDYRVIKEPDVFTEKGVSYVKVDSLPSHANSLVQSPPKVISRAQVVGLRRVGKGLQLQEYKQDSILTIEGQRDMSQMVDSEEVEVQEPFWQQLVLETLTMLVVIAGLPMLGKLMKVVFTQVRNVLQKRVVPFFKNLGEDVRRGARKVQTSVLRASQRFKPHRFRTYNKITTYNGLPVQRAKPKVQLSSNVYKNMQQSFTNRFAAFFKPRVRSTDGVGAFLKPNSWAAKDLTPLQYVSRNSFWSTFMLRPNALQSTLASSQKLLSGEPNRFLQTENWNLIKRFLSSNNASAAAIQKADSRFASMVSVIHDRQASNPRIIGEMNAFFNSVTAAAESAEISVETAVKDSAIKGLLMADANFANYVKNSELKAKLNTAIRAWMAHPSQILSGYAGIYNFLDGNLFEEGENALVDYIDGFTQSQVDSRQNMHLLEERMYGEAGYKLDLPTSEYKLTSDGMAYEVERSPIYGSQTEWTGFFDGTPNSWKNSSCVTMAPADWMFMCGTHPDSLLKESNKVRRIEWLDSFGDRFNSIPLQEKGFSTSAHRIRRDPSGNVLYNCQDGLNFYISRRFAIEHTRLRTVPGVVRDFEGELISHAMDINVDLSPLENGRANCISMIYSDNYNEDKDEDNILNAINKLQSMSARLEKLFAYDNDVNIETLFIAHGGKVYRVSSEHHPEKPEYVVLEPVRTVQTATLSERPSKKTKLFT